VGVTVAGAASAHHTPSARGGAGSVSGVSAPTTRWRRGLLAGAALLALGGAACGSGDGDATPAPAPATIAPDAAVAAPGCESVEPGAVVDAALAVISFDDQGVCPGWVTVVRGTQVTFRNADDTAHTVTVTETQVPDAAEVARFEVAPGASQPFDTLAVGRMGFATDALPGFRGTIEVVEGDGTASHAH
jgi:plastocyanin